MSVFHNNMLVGAAGATGTTPFDSTLIGNSVWLDGSADFFKRDDWAISADGRKEFIFSMWIQRNEFGRAQTHFDLIPTGHTSYNDGTHFIFAADDQLAFSVANGGSSGGEKITSAAYRDIGWYHVLISYNTNASILAASRHRLFVNGLEITDTSAFTAPSDNQSCLGSGTGNADLRIGRTDHSGIPYPPNAYFAQACYLEGKSFQAGDFAITDFLDSFTFGTNGSQFVPKADADIAALASTVGGNSFCLDFADSSGTDAVNLGNDISSNNKDLTPTSMAAANQSTNTPSNTYAVMDVTKNDGTNTSTMVFSEGSTRVTGTGGSDGGAFSTLPLPTSGTTEFQSTFNNGDGVVGICCYDNLLAVSSSASRNVTGGLSNNYNAAYAYQENGEKVVVLSGGVTRSAQGAALTTNSVVTVRYDADSNEITFLKDNTVQGSAVSTVAGLTYYAFVARFNNYDITLHFDSADFPHTIGSGNKTINTANLSAPTYQGIDYFDVTRYEGNGGGQRVGDFVPFTDLYTVDKSIIFDDGDSRGLNMNPSGTADSSTVAAVSLWTKRGNLGTDQRPYSIRVDGNTYFSIYYDTSDQLDFTINDGGSTILQRITTRVFKDSSAWHNIVVIFNQANGTQADRVKIFYDGVQIPNTSDGFGTNTCNLDGSSALGFLSNGSAVHHVGGDGFSQHYDGYVAEVVHLDGANSGNSLDASSFGQVDTSTNKWTAKNVSGLTFGTNGYYLEFEGDFSSESLGNDAGKDFSGSGNHFDQEGTFGTADQSNDTPSANFPTLNRTILPVPTGAGGGNATVSEGNLKLDYANGSSGNSSAQTTSLVFQIPDGKWYYELESVDSAGGNIHTGLLDMFAPPASLSSGFLPEAIDGQVSYGIGGSSTTTDFITIDGTTLSGSSSPFNGADDIDNGDVLGVYIEKSGNSYNFWFSRNGTMLVRNTSGLPMITYSRSNPMCVFVRSTNNTTKECALNFGQQMVFDGGATTASAATGGRWKHAPTNTDYKALSQDNLDDTASKLTALAWIKNRDATDHNMLANRVRGPQFINNSSSNSTGETTNVNAIQRFLQRGVQVGSAVEVNTANESYVLWQWLMGGSATTGSAISAGSISYGVPSIASTVLVADVDHMSIGTFTGTGSNGTVGHGLSAAPEAFVVFNPNAAARFKMFYHKDSNASPASGYIHLESPEAFQTDSTIYNNTVPNSTVFSVGTNVSINEDTKLNTFIAWRSVAGVCKVGTYTGNGDANGPYIDLGFKPAFFMAKSTGVENWVMLDNQRPNYNPTGGYLFANLTNVEGGLGSEYVDFLSSGVKLRTTGASVNGSATFIYLAMADIGGNGTLPPIYGR